MKKYLVNIAFILSALCLGTPNNAMAGDCDIDISVANITKGDIVPPAVGTKLEAKLQQAISRAGLIAAPYDSRFFVAGRFDDALNDITGGPSPKVLIKTTLTLYIGDADTKQIYATESFELKGVGGTDEKAYTNALNNINGTNPKLVEFFRKGKDRIIEYYDANYPKILNQAQQSMAGRDYSQALFYLTTIPSCCKGYAEACTLALKAYGDNINYEGETLLAEAKKEWAKDPTQKGADKALSLISQIDPAASCSGEAQKLGSSIAKAVQKQWEFENVTKYKDQLALENKKMDQAHQREQSRIAAAKAIGVAWASNQPKTVVYNRYSWW